MNQREYDKDIAILTSRLITNGKYIVIDTETTGLTEPEACQIAWVLEGGERDGKLVKPIKPIESGAELVHHISNEMVMDAEPLTNLLPKLSELSMGRAVIFYNAPFDTGVIARSTKTEYKPSKLHDAMLIFSAYYNMWDSFHGNYKWHKLSSALISCGIKTDETLHDASTDAYMTRELLLHIAKQPTSGERELQLSASKNVEGK
jgi:DNA polymerase-3 subunit epsilon